MDIYSVNKVIGVIEQELSEKHVRIKPIALRSDKGETTRLSEQDALRLFPPKGYVFEPSFFQNFKFLKDEVIAFHVDQNLRAEGDLDKFRIHPEKHQSVKQFGHIGRMINGFAKKNLTLDLSLLSVDGDSSDGEFWGITDKYIVGKLRMKNGKIEPAHNNRIKVWDREDSIVIEYKKAVRIEKLPEESPMILDCMDDRQLFEWFRAKLKVIDSDYVQMFDLKAKWRDELPKLFPQLDEEQKEVDQIRFRRIEHKFNAYNFSFEELKKLSTFSAELKTSFEQALTNHKLELQNNFLDLQEQYQKQIDEKATVITNKNSEIQSLEDRTTNLKRTLNDLENSKERILQDFSIIKDVLGPRRLTTPDSDSFLIESVSPPENSTRLASPEQFISKIKFQLSAHKLNSNYASRIIEAMSSYRALFIADIRLGISFAKATANAKFIIQQTEPDWLRFKDFWHNGLSAIWHSAHTRPEEFHFLFIQDINLASPECYARPLLDCICGIRSQIPLGKNRYPDNLWIMATKAPTDQPKIGLPLNESTFPSWGAIGFKDGLRNENKTNIDDIPGFLSPSSLQAFKDIDFIAEEFEARIKSDLKKVFDE